MRQSRSVWRLKDVAMQATRLLIRKGVARRHRVDCHIAKVESKLCDDRVELSSLRDDRVDFPGTFEAGLVVAFFLLKVVGGRMQSSTCINT